MQHSSFRVPMAGRIIYKAHPYWTGLFIGRGDRIRTYDPLLPKQMRYQAAPRPD